MDEKHSTQHPKVEAGATLCESRPPLPSKHCGTFNRRNLLNRFAISGQLHPRSFGVVPAGFVPVAAGTHGRSCLPGHCLGHLVNFFHCDIPSSFQFFQRNHHQPVRKINTNTSPSSTCDPILPAICNSMPWLPCPGKSGNRPWPAAGEPRVGTCLDSWRPSWLALPEPQKFHGRLKSFSWRDDTVCDRHRHQQQFYSTPPFHVFSAFEEKPPTGLEMVSLESATVSRLTEIPRRHISSRCEITVDIYPVSFLKGSQLCQLWLHNNNTEPCTTQKRISKRDNNRGSHH